jgi:hypothetical protein
MRMATLGIASALSAALVGCGPNSATNDKPAATVVDLAQLPCLVRPTTIPNAANMPGAMVRAERLLSGTTAQYAEHYPQYRGFGEAVYVWTGLISGPATRLVSPSKGANAGSERRDLDAVDNLPHTGPLFTDYPTQIFDVALQVDDFGLHSSHGLVSSEPAELPGE